MKDAVDYVLTFEEVQQIFDFAGIQPETLPDDDREHSSRAGRIYARTGGVSEAVQSTVKRLNPDRPIPVKAQQANGVPSCKAMLNDLKEGKVKANFLEGMGCVGGCVGGPSRHKTETEAKKARDQLIGAAEERHVLENLKKYPMDEFRCIGIKLR